MEHTCALDIPYSDISAKTMINLITNTLQSRTGPEYYKFLQLFQMFFRRLRINYNAVDDGDNDCTSFKDQNQHKALDLLV